MAADSQFRMKVADVFGIKGRGTVAMGQIETGTLNVGDEIEIVRASGSRQKAVVAGLEMLRKQLPQAGAGDTVGVLLPNVSKTDIGRGDILTGFASEFTWKP